MDRIGKGIDISRIGGEEERDGELNGQLNESQEDTLAFIRNHEGYNTTKIAEALSKPFRTIDKHINALLKAGLIGTARK